MKQTNTLLILAMLLVGTGASFAFVSAQTSTEPFVRVGWQVIDEQEEFEHEAQNSQWVFGPQPSIWIGFADNLTSIRDNLYNVNPEVDLLLNISIPKVFLGEENTLDTVRFWGAQAATRPSIFIMEYNVTADRWVGFSLKYAPGREDPVAGDFLNLVPDNCEYLESDDEYRVVFAFSFSESVGSAIFWTGMQAIDQLGRPVSPSWLAALQGGGFVTPPIAVGLSVSPRDFSLPEYFYGEIVGTDGKIKHYASQGETFKVRIMAGKALEEVLIPFALLDWNSTLRQWVNYTQPQNYPLSMFDPDPVMEEISHRLPPMMFLHYNSSGVHYVAGYLNVTFDWIELDDGIGIWFPNFDIKYNSTLSIDHYFVVDPLYNGTFDEGRGIEWGGYFTENANMNPDPAKIGAVIQPEMALAKVVNIDGDRLQPRPEIKQKETMKLAFEAQFIEAFVLDQYGSIAMTAVQGEVLNMTLLVHKPIHEINGSTTYWIEHEGEPYLLNISRHLDNFSIEIEGSGGGLNRTHHWQSKVTYNMTLNFNAMNHTAGAWLVNRTYERGGGLVDEATTPIDEWIILDFSIDINQSLTVLKIEFQFHVDSPSMVFDTARLNVGLTENLYIWIDPHGWYQDDEWKDMTVIVDLTPDTLWSPNRLLLGDVDSFTPPLWTVTSDGAIDLDGNTYTTDDQYFVKRTGFWRDNGTITTEAMGVGLVFDPTPGDPGDEFWSENWMGVRTLEIEFEANETFYWYRANDMSLVDEDEMNEIRSFMWADEAKGIAAPGYDYVAWLSVNRTLDLSSITGLESNEWSSTWFAWGTRQTFSVSVSDTTQVYARFRASYAGLMLFKDSPDGASLNAPDFSIEEGKIVTDEVTHVVLIDSADSISFRRPFGATNNSGLVHVDPDTTIEFGVSIYDVNVTIYPIGIEHAQGIRGPWAFRQSYEGALGLNKTNFDYAITTARVQEMAFDVTFSIDMVEFDPEDERRWNHAVSFKVDQTFGNWTLNEFGNEVLEGYGLAVNFFGVLGTAARTQHTAGRQPVTDTNSASMNASYYQFGAQDSPFANVSMGGLPYTWGGDGHSTTYISGSSTAPIGAFSMMYESTSGQSVTDWKVEASMLFMTAGYTNWGGHEIICDPAFVSYSSAYKSQTDTIPTTTTTTPTPTTTTPSTPSSPIDLYVLVAGVLVVIVAICALIRRR